VTQTLTNKTLEAASGSANAAILKGVAGQNARLLVMQDNAGA